MTTAPAPAPTSRDDRWLWLLFAAAWCAHFYFSLIGWENTLLSRFQFRQVQTAISTLFFPAQGFPLDYELPLFGQPWSVPLELPVYQASVVWFARLTGLALDPAGRAVSWLYFQTALPALFLLLGSAGMRRPHRWICLALFVTSPLYLFFSRCFLIESLAVAASLWFLAAFFRLVDGRKPGWLVVCWLAGGVAGTVKITTWTVFLVAAGLWCLARWRRDPRLAARETRTTLWLVLLAVLPPVLAALGWTWHAKTIRDLNPESGILNTHFGFWSFGDLTQRLSWDYWQRTTEVWINGVMSDAGLVAGLLLFVRTRPARRTLVLGAFATFLSGQLIFSNLYKVHDYYFYANGVFLIIALGLVLADFFEDPAVPRWLRWTLPAVLVACQLASYGRSYLPSQRIGEAPPEYTRAVRELTRPDDLVIILGQDWDAGTPYYAQRRSLMFTDGRERDRVALKRSIDGVDASRVGAVLIFGQYRNDSTFVHETMARLELGPTPLLIYHPLQVGIWIPQPRLAEVMDKLPARPYATLDLVQSRTTTGDRFTVGLRVISRLREFEHMHPRPYSATSITNFSQSLVGQEMVLNAHAPFDLAFHLPTGAKTVSAGFGIHDGAYTNPAGHTDGVEFVFLHRTPDGRERPLFTRYLDPYTRPGDRGLQRIELALPAGPGDLIVRNLMGPAGNASYDWAYFSALTIK